MFGKYVENVRERASLVHCITNYVTVNDVANMILACGASPIMADDPQEVREITALSDGLTINLGTLHQQSITSMKLSLAQAKEKNIPRVLDPVGAGASTLRTRTALTLLGQGDFTVIRGNSSELCAMIGGKSNTRGVDADIRDELRNDHGESFLFDLQEFARKYKAVVVVTGAVDIVTDGKTTYRVSNGRKEMSRVTGTGCQLSGLIGAFVAANPKRVLEATVAAVGVMGVAGEIAWNRMTKADGNGTYRNRIIDAVFHMDGETLERRMNVETF